MQRNDLSMLDTRLFSISYNQCNGVLFKKKCLGLFRFETHFNSPKNPSTPYPYHLRRDFNFVVAGMNSAGTIRYGAVQIFIKSRTFSKNLEMCLFFCLINHWFIKTESFFFLIFNPHKMLDGKGEVIKLTSWYLDYFLNENIYFKVQCSNFSFLNA